MTFEDLKELGDEEAVKKAGKLRQQGKKYVVQDADVIYFKVRVHANRGVKLDESRKHFQTEEERQLRLVGLFVSCVHCFAGCGGREGMGRARSDRSYDFFSHKFVENGGHLS